MAATNREGLTYQEWLYAAGYGHSRTAARKVAWERGEDPSDHRAAGVQTYPRRPTPSAVRSTTRNRVRPSKAAKAQMIHRGQTRMPPVIVIDEREPEGWEEFATPAEFERWREAGGAEWSVHVQGPGANALTERLQYTQGSTWENDGPDFAYNIFQVNNQKERKAVLAEFRKAGATVMFTDSHSAPVRGLLRNKRNVREGRTGRRARRTMFSRYG